MARNGNSKGMKETKFKDTELGKIPEEWDYGKFEDYLDKFSAGATPYRGIASNFIGTIPWVSSGELNYNYITDTREHISQDAQKSTHLTLHPKGTFLIAITGLEAAGTRGRCAFIETPATTNQSCLAIYSTEKMIVEYLFWFYQQWSDYLAFNFSQGSKQQSFTAEIVKKLPIYAPSLSEQQRIASALSDADALVTELDVLIEKKRAIMAGTMQELLTGKRRLQGFDEPWVERILGQIGTFVAGNGFPLIHQGKSKGKYPFYKVSDMNNSGNQTYMIVANNHIDQEVANILNCNIIPANSIVFAKIGAAIFLERKRLTSIDCCIDNNMQSFQCNKSFDCQYALWLLRSIKIADSVSQTALPALKVTDLKKIEVYIPSSLAEQRAIASILSDMDAEIAELEAKRDKYKEVRQGMMQQLLTGKIRLI